jgi:AcrR family transcriptional regulator
MRTRALLQDALTALMIEKGYETITIQEIIDRANLGRATFYAHFADKRTLLSSRLEDLRSSLLARQRESLTRDGGVEVRSGRCFSFSKAMLEHAESSLPLWKAIAGAESGAFVLRRLHEMLAELVRNDLAAMGMKRQSAEREMLTQLIAGAFIAVMRWWLDAGAKLSVDDVNDAFCRAAMRGLRAALP